MKAFLSFKFFPLSVGIFCSVAISSILTAQETPNQDRQFTVEALKKIAAPVLKSAAAGTLKEDMPIETNKSQRSKYAHLEALGRTLNGISPWLALGSDDTEEGKLRAEFIQLARQGIIQATKREGEGRLIFGERSQPLVDAAFLAQALLDAQEQLWDPLSQEEKNDVIFALKETREIKPGNNNWLLFSALVESAIWKFTGETEIGPIKTALDAHSEWYLGDGTYGDGPKYRWDYYNSYVIQPSLLTVGELCLEKNEMSEKNYEKILARAQRYAVVQERMISPEASYPIIGRSSAYRFGAFHHLSYMSWKKLLPKQLSPAAVRSGLTAVIRRVLAAEGTFDKDGWLQIGAVGHQKQLGERYINTGSLYLCLFGMKHLGLPSDDPFWTSPAEDWTQKRLWAGDSELPIDKSIR